MNKIHFGYQASVAGVDQYSKRLTHAGATLIRLFSVSLIMAVLAACAAPAHIDGTAQPEDAQDHVVFRDPPPPQKGWQALANVLDTLSPRVDTRLELSAAEVTDRIEGLIANGQYNEALQMIEQRKEQRAAQASLGTDVQLLFLEGRALAAAGRRNEAIDVYREMTVRFPELPEPWNNLAAEYVHLQQFELAAHALQTALASDPNYATAHFNLGMVQLMQAHQTFETAAQLGAAGADVLATKTAQVIQP